MSTEFTETEKRLYDMLLRELGPLIHQGLVDDDIDEIMLNPDGGLWFDGATHGMVRAGELSKSQADSIVASIAGINDMVVGPKNPLLEAVLPRYAYLKGERFTAQVSPVVAAPAFCLRKRARHVFSLNKYVETGRLTASQKAHLVELVRAKANILVCGGPGSGKTTVTNALIQEAVAADLNQRFIVIEDSPELKCEAPNAVPMTTTVEEDMTDLLRSAMRQRPDRILIGEVRGAEALDMLKAWNTGCPGGICTVHANGPEEAIQRILDLAMEAGQFRPPYSLVWHTIDAVVFVTRQGSQKGFIKEIAKLEEIKNDTFVMSTLH